MGEQLFLKRFFWFDGETKKHTSPNAPPLALTPQPVIQSRITGFLHKKGDADAGKGNLRPRSTVSDKLK
jgi:hypothetical protein